MYTVTKSRALGVSCQMVCKAVWQSYPRKYWQICCAENPSVLARWSEAQLAIESFQIGSFLDEGENPLKQEEGAKKQNIFWKNQPTTQEGQSLSSR